jgi:hypothetical protein
MELLLARLADPQAVAEHHTLPVGWRNGGSMAENASH